MAQLSFEDENNNSEGTIDTSELDVPDIGTSIIAEIELPDIETIDVGGVEDAQIEGYLDLSEETAKQRRASEEFCDWQSRVSRLYWDSACSIEAYRRLTADGNLRSKLQNMARYLSDYIGSLSI